MTRFETNPNFADYLTVGEAAKYLGVSTATLRNWDKLGKLTPRRHPQNGYRIYLHEDLEKILRSANLAELDGELFSLHFDWSQMDATEHFVQFYESDEYLIESLTGYVGHALIHGNSSVVIATPEHRIALQRKLASGGLDVGEAIESGRYVVLDAADTLAKFMVGGSPDPWRFQEVIGGLVAQVADGGRRVHAFGEMVALLWAEGNREAAIALEGLWNELGKSHRFALYCAYPIAGFNHASDAASFNGVCNCHSRLMPTESYSGLDEESERLRAFLALQQKAQSLAAEIEHRQEVERALWERERELADFFNNAIEGLHKVGPDGTILWANKAECNLLGYAPEEYVGRPISDFHADAEVIADILQRLNSGETLHNYPARLRCKNGAIKHVLISSNAFMEDGQLVYTRCFTRDITPQWQAEQALVEADRRKDEFLATLSHELRNPLAPIRNALGVVRSQDANSHTRDEALSVIDRQVGQLTRLVDDLLDVSRITRNRIELRKERTELAAIIQSAVETSRPLIDEAAHELTIELPPEPIFIHVDPTRMAQVFANLLTNAAKYTEPGGRIWLHARCEEPEVVVGVRDNGVGIACEALAHVFDMFQQSDRSLDRAQGGLGIGLTLVRRLVELHGGAVNAQSEGPGKGSEFTVRLPLARPELSNGAAPQPSAVRALSRLRILVADDNLDAGKTMSMLLQLKGHEVRTARDGLEAVQAAAEFRPDVILMDIGMPKLNGYDATRRIREKPWGSDVAIIALTGWGQAEDVNRSREAGCTAHLVKPVDFAALERLLVANALPAPKAVGA